MVSESCVCFIKEFLLFAFTIDEVKREYGKFLMKKHVFLLLVLNALNLQDLYYPQGQSRLISFRIGGN